MRVSEFPSRNFTRRCHRLYRHMVRSLRLSSRICLTYIVEYDLFNENVIFLRIHLQILSEAIKESQAAGITSNRIDRCGHRRYRKLEKYRKKKEEKKIPGMFADNRLRNVNVKSKMIRLNLFDVFLGQVNFYPQFYSLFFLLIANSVSKPLHINNSTL